MANALLDALGYVGDSLNKPGRAVRGVLGGRPEEAKAAIPFSDTLGLTDPANEVTGRDLVDKFGLNTGSSFGDDALGFGIGMATDPLSYFGAGLGAKLGGRAAEAALARGPRYGTTAADLAGLVAGHPQAESHLASLVARPNAGRVLSEIPPGSSFLGAGEDAMAFRTPQGGALRVGEVGPGTVGRPVSNNVVQSTRAIDVPGDLGSAVRVDRTPLATDVGASGLSRRSPQTMLSPVNELDQRLAGDGLSFWDRHLGNVGTEGGIPKVIDPGAVQTLPGFSGGFQPVAQAAEASPLMRALIHMGGGDPAVQAAIEAGTAPGFARKFGVAGGLGGAALGQHGQGQQTY